MKEHPILFSSTMINALLEGRKTQTRRIIKPQPIDNTEIDGNFFEGDHKGFVKVDGHPDWRDQFVYEFCKYSVGDVLWVREMLYQNGELGLEYVADREPIDEEIIPPDHKPYRNYAFCNIPSIHMPKWACRIKLEITEIRVERLQDISPGDACDEGIEFWNVDHDAFEGGELVAEFKNYTWKDKESYKDYHFPTFASCIESYRTLWESINGEKSWESNPWVWVVKFKKL